MYGFVNSALEKLVKRRFGADKWEEISTHAKLLLGEQDSFHVNHVYKDEDTYTVVAAASEVLGLDAATILEMFGEQFLISCQESGYAKTLQLLGRSLPDFLANLDALHDHLSIIYPQMDAPSFRCTAGVKKSEFLLHYYSDRPGLEHIVMGIVRSVAREYYHVELEMKVMVKKGENSDHTIFSIRQIAYHRASVVDREDMEQDVKSFSKQNLISSETFCKAFPFHIVFDSHMTILQVGLSLSWVMPNLQLKKDTLTTYFELERPRVKLTFANIMSHINTIYILRMVAGSLEKGNSNRMASVLASSNDPMRLRGQMVFAPESEAMLFICSPRVKRLQDLEQRGLYLSDIPIHDATRGMLMMGQAAAAEFSKSVRLEELIIDLHHTQKSLEEEKKRMSDLLHQMLPISVADSLMAGQMVEAERFESVTILFSDIVGFTSICSHSEPMQIISMLNKLYSLFDQVVGQNQVYKVETIGDAYMVVGGLPEKNTIHAECVANQALDMMHYCKQVMRPDLPNETITMRIGIHSGAVVAGVVGRRMPRYCLFGNAVNVASRTESNGTPGKIQVTEHTYSLLADQPNFEFEFRDSLQFKNVPAPIKCYYLLDNTYREEHTAILVSEEPEQVSYQFMISRSSDTPPLSPLMSASRLDNEGGDMMKFPPAGCPMFIAPDLNVIKPTPTSTPNPSPPSSRKNSDTVDPSLDATTAPPIFPAHDGPYEGTDFALTDDSLRSHLPTSFMTSMRNTSMSPLREDFDEEDNSLFAFSATSVGTTCVTSVGTTSVTSLETTGVTSLGTTGVTSLGTTGVTSLETTSLQETANVGSPRTSNAADEGIVMRKISDVSNSSAGSGGGTDTGGTDTGGTDTGGTDAGAPSSSSKLPSRKISDTSNHSGESGIDSTTSKISDTSKDGLPFDGDSSKGLSTERKLSNSSSSSTEDELAMIRRTGSVSQTVERYNSLTRQRKTGLPTVVGNGEGNSSWEDQIMNSVSSQSL